jgi:FKBP12-rapamycin complex-associated protein
MFSFAADPMSELSVAAEQAKLPVNQVQLKAAWRLGNELMRESPSQAIRASRNLAEVHPPFARELFNVAFVSCWAELYDQYQVGTARVPIEYAR